MTRFSLWFWGALSLCLAFLAVAGCSQPSTSVLPAAPLAEPSLATAPTSTPIPQVLSTATPPAQPTPSAVPSPTATSTQSPSPPAKPDETPSISKTGRPLVGLIAGHGGPDSGAVHRDSQSRVDLAEKDLTLAVALRLRDLLLAKGLGVVLDRERDAAILAGRIDLNGDGLVDDADEIQARLDVLNAAGADLLVSIHFNGFDSPTVRGTATYYCPDQPFASQSRRLAGLVQKELVDRLRGLGAQVADKGVQDDAVLGKPYGHLMTLGPATPKIVRPGKMPGVLVEPLFLTNEYEAGLLKDKATLEAIAQGLAQAIEAYLPAGLSAPTPVPTPTATPPPKPAATVPREATREIVRGPAVPQVSLTFDLGSGATHTPAILEALEKAGIRTTFFMTGQWVEANPAMAKRILELGHEPGNHSYSHPDLTKLSDGDMLKELSGMEESLQKATGRSSKPWFRPPFGARDGRVLGLVASQGYRSIYWTLDSADWRPEFPAADVRERVVSQSSPGAIVVMHGDSPQTAEVLGSIIAGLRARGLEPVSLSQLLAQ